nr:hypothetical protein [uncultured Pedobacter sp.]
MISLFKKKTINPVSHVETDLFAQRIAEKIIYYQKKCSDRLDKLLRRVPSKIQRIGFTLLISASTLYCGSLIFKTPVHPFVLKTIKPLKNNKVLTADSLQNLENIYQHYLKR